MALEGGGGSPEAAAPRVGLRTIVADRDVRVIVLIVFVVMLGLGIVAPILPLYARSFGVDYGAAGLLVSAFAVTRLAVDPFAGPLVDRLGERVSSVLAVAVVAVSSVLTGLAPTFPMAVVFRGLGGGGSALLFTALISYLMKVVPRDRMARTLGIFYGSFNVGIIAGAPLGGLIAARLGLASPLFFYAGLLVLAGVLYLRLVRDPVARGAGDEGRGEDGRPPGGRSPLLTRGLLTATAANFAYLWMIAGVYDTLVPLFGSDRLGMTPFGIGVVFAVALGTELAVLYPAGLLADRRGRRVVLVPSLAALAALVAVLGLAGDVLAFGASMAVLGVAVGAAGVPPGAILADVAPEGRSATVVGVFRFAGDLGLLLGPLTAGFAVKAMGFSAAFVIAAIPLVLALALALATPETLRREPEIAEAGPTG